MAPLFSIAEHFANGLVTTTSNKKVFNNGMYGKIVEAIKAERRETLVIKILNLPLRIR